MTSLLFILVSAVLVTYLAIAHIPALRPLLTTDEFEAASGVACAVFLMLTFIAPAAYLLEHAMLVPLQIEYLRIVILVIVAMMSAVGIEMLLRHWGRWRPLRQPFMLLMTTNAAVLGTALLSIERASHFLAALRFGLGTGVTFAIMLMTLSTLQQRLRHAAIPTIFREAPLALVSAGILALGFMGFSGLIRD